jgi:hypothetical protein
MEPARASQVPARRPAEAPRHGQPTGAAAALGEHPGAVVDRVEVDAHGLYAVRLLTTWGEQVVVQVDSDLTVLGWLAFPR